MENKTYLDDYRREGSRLFKLEGDAYVFCFRDDRWERASLKKLVDHYLALEEAENEFPEDL